MSDTLRDNLWVDTDFILNDNLGRTDEWVQRMRQIVRAVRRDKNLDVNYRQLKEDFVFALTKCISAAFGEQNKTDNDSKCQQVYKSLY